MPESMPWRDKSPKPATGGVYYLSDSFKVRSRNKRDGSIDFPIERPEGGELDSYPTAYQSMFIAEYCDRHHDGSYAAEARHAARAAYDQHMEDAPDEVKTSIPGST